MAAKYDYGETFESRIQDVRLDGPSMYTSLLEKVDNSIGWGNADTVELSYDKQRMIIILSDNGPNGFNNKESFHRFFKLGGKNDLVNEKTIGKFGRGGYKATMNISDSFELVSVIDGRIYSLSTDFISMIENNTQRPSGDFKSHENDGETKKGSKFTLKIRPEYHNKFNTSTFNKNFVRAYHNFPDIKLILDGKEYIPSVNCPYKDYIIKKVYTLYWDSDNNKFNAEKYVEEIESDYGSDSETGENINRFYIGKIKLYVLKDMITKNYYLGDHPGMDVYRNNRLCNTHNPLRNIGNIGDNLGHGQMRGMRCHMVFTYENKLLADDLDVDDCIGLTTNKEIPEDASKLNESLLEILEEKAKECSKMYEDTWEDRKTRHIKHIEDTNNLLKKLDKYTDNDLYHDNEDIKKIEFSFGNFNLSQAWKINEEDMGYHYFKDKKDVKKAEAHGEEVNKVRRNSPLFENIPNIIALSKKILSRKNKYKKYVDKINKKKEELNVEFNVAKKIYDTLCNLKEIEEENEEHTDNHNISSGDCVSLINNCNKIKSKIAADINVYFIKKLEENNNNIIKYEKMKENKLVEEEAIRIEEANALIKANKIEAARIKVEENVEEKEDVDEDVNEDVNEEQCEEIVEVYEEVYEEVAEAHLTDDEAGENDPPPDPAAIDAIQQIFKTLEIKTQHSLFKYVIKNQDKFIHSM